MKKGIQYLDCINGYDVYIYGKTYCKENRLPYPCYAAFPEGSEPELFNEECSLEDLDDLLLWCEEN